MAFLQHSAHEQKSLTSSQTASLQIPVWGKIHELILRFATAADADATEAAIRSEIGNIRLSINGKDVVNASAAKIYDLYEVLGIDVGANTGIGGAIELNIGRLLFIDPMARDLFGFGTLDVANIQVQVTAGTLSTIASVQAFTGREAGNFNLGAYCKFLNYVQSFNAASDHTVDTLPRDVSTSYLMLLADSGASGTITKGECRVNNQSIMDSKFPKNVNAVALSNVGLQQPAGYFVYNFTDRGLAGRLPMAGVTDLRFVTTFSVAPGAAGYNMSALSVENLPTK